MVIETFHNKNGGLRNKTQVFRGRQGKKQPGVHIHLFCCGKGNIPSVSVLIQRADNGLWGVISGKIKPGEADREAVFRETLEETGIMPDIMMDTGHRMHIPCQKYCLSVSVFAAVVWGCPMPILNEENQDWEVFPVSVASQQIEIQEQRADHMRALRTLGRCANGNRMPVPVMGLEVQELERPSFIESDDHMFCEVIDE